MSRTDRPFWHSEPAPDGSRGAVCYRRRGYKRKDGTRKPNCPEGWHQHGPYLPVGLLGDEWYWKEPKS